jgi:hypothetical protein
MLTAIRNAVLRLIDVVDEHLAAPRVSGYTAADRRSLHDIGLGYVHPTVHGRPRRLLYQEPNRRGTQIWRAA